MKRRKEYTTKIHFRISPEDWKEFFLVYVEGYGAKQWIFQLSIFAITIAKYKKDRMIKCEKGWYRNPKYDNDDYVSWNWSIQNGFERF